MKKLLWSVFVGLACLATPSYAREQPIAARGSGTTWVHYGLGQLIGALIGWNGDPCAKAKTLAERNAKAQIPAALKACKMRGGVGDFEPIEYEYLPSNECTVYHDSMLIPGPGGPSRVAKDSYVMGARIWGTCTFP